jgi:hypothetical protein
VLACLIRWTLLCAFFFSSSSAFAALLEGVVFDDSGARMPTVDVVVALLPEGGVRRGATSDSLGRFQIDRLRSGRYSVLATRIGYESARDTIEIAEPGARLELVLIESAILMDPVDVHGQSPRDDGIQTGLVQLDRTRLRRMPAVGESDPLRSLQLLPGVQAASDFSSGLYIRGGGPDQNLVLLDGVTIYNPTHAFGFFSTFNADVVQEVSLYKSAYPAQYGGRLGAVVDVRSLEPTSGEVEGEIALGSVTSHILLQGPSGRDRRSGWYVAGRRTFLEPFLSAMRREDSTIPHYYFYDLNGGYRWSHSDGSRTIATVYQGRDNLRLDLDDDTFVRLRWGNTAASATHTRIVATRFLTRWRGAISHYRSESSAQIFTTPASFANRVVDATAGVEAQWEAGPDHHLLLGSEATRYWFEFDQIFNGETQIRYRQSPYDLSLYAQLDWMGEPARIQTGVRTRYFSAGQGVLFEPRFSLSRPVTEQVRLKLGGGLYHQYVQLVSTEGFSAADFYVPIDRTAKPGRSYQGTAAIDWEPSIEYQLGVESYFTLLRDVVMLDDRAPNDQSAMTAEEMFVTGGRGWSAGWEIFAQRRTGSLTGWIGYTLGWTRRTFPELNDGNSFPPKYDRRHDLSAVASWKRGSWTYAASFTYGTGQAFTPAAGLMAIRNPAEDDDQFEVVVLPGERNSARLLPYHRLDLGVSRDFTLFGRNAAWTAQVFNLYSRRNEWFVQYGVERLTTEPEIYRMLPVIPSLALRVEL